MACLMLIWFVFSGLAFNGGAIDIEAGKVGRLSAGGTLDLVQVAPALSPNPNDEGTCKSRVEIYGYKCEEHTVTTEDGYILSIQRIPAKNKIPVLLQHGLLMDGITWLLNSPQESLGYILADNGYDVWIANTRGTTYSQGHTSLTPNDPAYWDWSWDDLVAYDLPATFSYVYTQTSQQKLHYVGHSLGTLVALASFSQHNLLSMLRSAALLSPIAYMDQLSSLLVRAAVDTFLAETIYWLGLHEFNPNSEDVHNLLTKLCKQPGIDCYDLMGAVTGKNCCLNSSSVQVFLDHEPQATATKNMIHLAQMIRRGSICMYDYGNAAANMKHYGQDTPPVYNMSQIPRDLPLFMGYGGKDELSDVKDVEHLLDSLNQQHSHDAHNLTVLYQDVYAHADFVMAVNANRLVYQPLITFFNLQDL